MTDFWEPVRRRWDELSEQIVNPLEPDDPVTKIKRLIWNPFVPLDLAIVVAGTRGTGKSTLHKALRRRLQVGDDVPRQKSKGKERDLFVLRNGDGRRRVELIVLPGQLDSEQGKNAIDFCFGKGRLPLGLVYITSWGLSTIWDAVGETAALAGTAIAPTGMTAISKDPAVELIRTSNLRQELDNFRWIKELVQQAWLGATRPVWLVIGVSKVDLYCDPKSLRQAGEYYIPAAVETHDSAFSGELRDLVNFLGYGRMEGRVVVLPVCSVPEQYRLPVANRRVSTTGGMDLPAMLLRELLDKIGELCGAEQK